MNPLINGKYKQDFLQLLKLFQIREVIIVIISKNQKLLTVKMMDGLIYH